MDHPAEYFDRDSILVDSANIDKRLSIIFPIFGGESCPVTGAVFKTVCEYARACLGGFDSHTPPPVQFGNWDLGIRI